MNQALVAGRDYPNTYREFVGMFPDVQACTAYLTRIRWPEGFICPFLRSGFYPVESKPSPPCMSSLPPTDHGHCGYDLRQNANPTDDLV